MVRVLDHYALLGIPVDSSAAAIKKMYRTLALRHHPDKNPGNDNAQKNFQMLQNAYDVLVDVNTRRNYDRARTLDGVIPSNFLPPTTKAPAERTHHGTGHDHRERVRRKEEERRQEAKEAEHIARRQEEEKRRQKAKEAERIARQLEEERRRQKAKEAERIARRLEEERRRQKAKEAERIARRLEEEKKKEKEAEENMVKWWVEQEEKRQRAKEAERNKTKWWDEDEKRQRARWADEEMARWYEEEMEKAEREKAEREDAERRNMPGIWSKMFQAQDIDTIDWMEVDEEADEDSFGLKDRNFQTPPDQPGVHTIFI